MKSVALRKYFQERYQIEVGMYSYGCFDASRIRPGVKVGRYCSFAPTVTILTRNHPVSFMTTHPVLYDASYGCRVARTVPFDPIEIEDDVWIGQNVVILPHVSKIGRGSVIGAGSIVTRDIPRYSIVAGVPAVQLRKRFDEDTIELLERSAWWNKSIEDVSDMAEAFPDLVFDPATQAKKFK